MSVPQDITRVYKIGVTAQLNTRSGAYEYHHVRYEARVTLQCTEPFRRGDAVAIEAIDSARHVITLRRVDAIPDAAMLFLVPGVPLAAGSDHAWSVDNAQILHVRPVELRGNKTYIILAAAPLVGMGAVTATETTTHEQFHFYFRERARNHA